MTSSSTTAIIQKPSILGENPRNALKKEPSRIGMNQLRTEFLVLLKAQKLPKIGIRTIDEVVRLTFKYIFNFKRQRDKGTPSGEYMFPQKHQYPQINSVDWLCFAFPLYVVEKACLEAYDIYEREMRSFDPRKLRKFRLESQQAKCRAKLDAAWNLDRLASIVHDAWSHMYQFKRQSILQDKFFNDGRDNNSKISYANLDDFGREINRQHVYMLHMFLGECT